MGTRVFLESGSSVAAAGNESLTDADNESWVIERIQVTEESATTLDASTATVSVGGNNVTDSSVIVSTMQADYDRVPVWDVAWPANKTFEFSWTNNSGAAATINVNLWVRALSGDQSAGDIVGSP